MPWQTGGKYHHCLLLRIRSAAVFLNVKAFQFREYFAGKPAFTIFVRFVICSHVGSLMQEIAVPQTTRLAMTPEG
ncbi:MAG: hypothetical protein KDH84_23400, partial [Calditrichaeota bacterium]|nr:hypothetical protein [Calditrichota bacterium]MCB0316159.1 hypothetical protein [Calditrichota bacterium]